MSRYIAYAAFFLTSLSVQGTELLVNGGFETGDFTGWLATARLTSGGELLVFDGTTSPLNGVYSLTGPREGDWFALIDQGIGPGSYALTQTFTVPVSATKVTLRFSFFAQNGHFETIIGPGLDHTGAPNQHAAIDLIAGDAGPFTDVVLRNFYKGADTVDGEAATYTDYVFDITSNVVPGGTYQIRAGQADNQFFFQSGFDNVSVGAQVVPEPSTAMLFGLAVICFGLLGRKRLRRPKFQCGHRWILQLCFIASITADIASALPISFDFKLMGSYKSQSLLSLRDISSWNGQPISDTNKPTDFNRKLEATTNMYVTPSFKNILFVQVTDVTTTEGWPAASASANIALTGIEFWLPSLNGKDLGIPLFSSDYANQGQRIIGPNGTATTPTEVTDGFDFFQGQSNGGYAIHTPNYTDNLAFGEWESVNGTRRTLGGGVFTLTFDPSINLISDVDFHTAELTTIFGNRNQLLDAEFVNGMVPGQPPFVGRAGAPLTDDPAAIPEPATMLSICVPLLGLICYGHIRLAKSTQVNIKGARNVR